MGLEDSYDALGANIQPLASVEENEPMNIALTKDDTGGRGHRRSSLEDHYHALVDESSHNKLDDIQEVPSQEEPDEFKEQCLEGRKQVEERACVSDTCDAMDEAGTSAARTHWQSAV